MPRKMWFSRWSRKLERVYQDQEEWVEMPAQTGLYDSDLRLIKPKTFRSKIIPKLNALGWLVLDLIVGPIVKRFIAKGWSRR